MSNIRKSKSLEIEKNYTFPGYSDTLILRSCFAVSSLITVAIVGLEISWKLAFGQNLIATSHTYAYMGMQVVIFLTNKIVGSAEKHNVTS